MPAGSNGEGAYHNGEASRSICVIGISRHSRHHDSPAADDCDSCFFGFKIYELVYFRSAKFIAIKNRISAHIQDCNDLNDHIEELKSTHIGADMTRRGHSDYHDNSKWNFKRSGFKKITNAPNVYNCSRSVCDGSRRDPMKYVCKYFGFSADEPTLSKFENMLNNFTAVEDGKNSLTSEKTRF